VDKIAKRVRIMVELTADESHQRRPGRDLITCRLVEIILIEILRSGTVDDLAEGLRYRGSVETSPSLLLLRMLFGSSALTPDLRFFRSPSLAREDKCSETPMATLIALAARQPIPVAMPTNED
jgi:hypothetical protein